MTVALPSDDRPMRGRVRLRRLLGIVAAVLLASCATPPGKAPAPATQATPGPAPAANVERAPAGARVLGRNERLLIYQPSPGEPLEKIAERFLGSADLAWMIAEANAGQSAESGMPLVVPLRALNPIGITTDRLQTIPILCYHRFGAGASKMVVSPTRFAAQLEWLHRNGYHVIRLSALKGFLAGRHPLPQKSVVITIDDGYESVHRHALPLLRQYGFPATLFVYSDFVGAGDALRWPQLQEMANSGLIDIQAHSKTHRNLIEKAPGETDERYRANLEAEMSIPRDVLQKRVTGAQVRHLAYPFGDANATVMESALRNGYDMGLTVVPGSNAFFAQPMLLRRTMIFGDLDLEGFKARLQTSRSLSAP